MAREYKIEILHKAVEENISIALGRSEKDKDEFNYASRFFEMDRKKKTITIDFPSTTLNITHLDKNEEIVVYFIYNNSRLVFHSKVLGISQFALSEEKTVKAMIVEYPESIIDGERRNFFKVTTPPFEVNVKILERKNIDDELYEDVIFKGISVNISAGGIAFKEGEEMLPFTYGDVIDVIIAFPGEPLHMEGKVVNKFTFENSDDMIFGIMFIQKDLDKLNFNRNVKNLMRYVVRRERELLFGFYS